MDLTGLRFVTPFYLDRGFQASFFGTKCLDPTPEADGQLQHRTNW
jgi:hypothetical protein